MLVPGRSKSWRTAFRAPSPAHRSAYHARHVEPDPSFHFSHAADPHRRDRPRRLWHRRRRQRGATQGGDRRRGARRRQMRGRRRGRRALGRGLEARPARRSRDRDEGRRRGGQLQLRRHQAAQGLPHRRHLRLHGHDPQGAGRAPQQLRRSSREPPPQRREAQRGAQARLVARRGNGDGGQAEDHLERADQGRSRRQVPRRHPLRARRDRRGLRDGEQHQRRSQGGRRVLRRRDLRSVGQQAPGAKQGR